MVSNCFYDFLTASQNTETLLQYSVNYRNFYLVTHGVIKIKLIPPKSARYLYPIEDYENFEFRSPLNPWAIQRQYKADYDKIKTLEIELTPGKIIYIPAYWWYSIKFMEPLSSMCVFKYRTYMNTVAILPKLCMKTLQRQNTKREIVKKVRFQKNEVATTKVVDKEKDKVKGLTTTITTMQYSNDCAAAAVAVTPVPVPANFESSALISNVNTVNRIDDNGTNEEANEEEDTKQPCNAITLSLVE
jgi:hypothetical protein